MLLILLHPNDPDNLKKLFMKNFTIVFMMTVFCLNGFGQQATFNWVKTDIAGDNNLQKMAVTGNEATIAGFGNSFFKSYNGGTSWDTLNFFNPMYNFMDISMKGNSGYVTGARVKLYDALPDVYAEGIMLKTTNAGTSWTSISLDSLGTPGDETVNPLDTFCYGKDFLAVEIINDSVAYCALRWLVLNGDDHSGIFKTTDSGKTWKNISGDLKGDVIAEIASYGNNVFIGGNKMLFKTTPSSDTLINILDATKGDGSDYFNDITMVNENEMYLITTNDSLYFSNDGGSTFGQFPFIAGGFDIYKVNDSTLVVGGSSNKSYVSTNHGQQWKPLGLTKPIWEIPGIVNDSLWMFGDAVIYKIPVSDLLSGKYNFITQTVGNGNLQKALIQGNNVLVTGNSATFISSSTGGQSWKNMDIPLDNELKEMYDKIDFNGLSMMGNEGYACFNRIVFVDYPTSSPHNDVYWSGGVVSTTDNWETIKSVDVANLGKANSSDPSANPNHASCNGVNTSVIEFAGNNLVFLWARWYDYSGETRAEHSRVFRSADGGKNWTAVTDDLGTKYVQAVKAKGDTVFVAGNSLLFRSVDKGVTFENIYPKLDKDENDAMFINSVTLGNKGEVFITTTADSVRMSTDLGETFRVLGNINGSSDFYQFDMNSYIFMGGTGKSKFTNDGGANWQECHPGAVIYEIGGVYNEKLYALAKGAFYTVATAALDLKTSVSIIPDKEGLTLMYKPESVEILSTGALIDRCEVYSVNGTLMYSAKPASSRVEFYRSNFIPGVYIVTSSVKNKIFRNKIVFK